VFPTLPSGHRTRVGFRPSEDALTGLLKPFLILLVLFGTVPLIIMCLSMISYLGQVIEDRKDQEQEEIKRERKRQERIKKKLGLKEESDPDRYWYRD
jgi:hypothetical protein